MKSIAEKEISYHFPQEIIFLILLRLPSKTLCRFLSVCKNWCKLIKNEAFISSHVNQNLNTEMNTHLLLRVFDHKNYGEEFIFYPFNQPKLEVPSFVLNPPKKSKSTCFRIHGTCNGLVCLSNQYSKNYDIILWNPSIKKYVDVPEPVGNIKRPLFGFGVNLLDNDFKVIRFGFSLMEDMCSTYAEVYSLRRGKWGEIQAGLSYILHSSMFPHQVFLNGHCHWLAHRAGTSSWFLISFNMRDEMFLEVVLPKELSLLYGATHICPKLTTIPRENKKECLAIIGRVKGLNGGETYCIWMMCEYGVHESWNKLYDIDLRLLRPDFRFFGFIQNGGILTRMGVIQLACYYPEDESLVKLNINYSAPSMFVNKYVETLVLLNHNQS